MKFVSWLLTLLVLLLAVCFALKNQQNITLNLWPAGIVVEAPLYLMTLGTLFAGILIGASIIWIAHLPRRLETRRLRRDIGKLHEKIEDMSAALPNAENNDAPKTKAGGFFAQDSFMSSSHNPVFCALDTADLARAEKLAAALQGHVHGFKLGLEFFLAHGVAGYKKIAETGAPIFLDLKLHDIPNTVASAITALLPLGPHFLTLHTSGGKAMMQAAVDAASSGAGAKPKLLGVTVLTSLNSADLDTVGQSKDVSQQAVRLAKLAQESGLDGVVCSPQEIKDVREACGPNFILMVPGIRPAWAKSDDQKRVMTPKEAKAAGATYLVIGRPITAAENPAEAARQIVAEMA